MPQNPNEISAAHLSRLEEAWTARRRGDFGASLDVLRSLEPALRETPAMQIEIARDLTYLGRLAEAEAVYDVLLTERGKIEPRLREQALRGKAQALQKRGEWLQATPILEELHGIAPHDSATAVQLATSFRVAGQLSQAVELAAGVLEREPENAAAAICLGWARRLSGNHGGALEAFQHAARLLENRADIVLEVARELASLGQATDALALLRQIDPAQPVFAKAIGLAAQSARAAQLHDQAAYWQGQICRIAPADFKARLQLAADLFLAGRGSEGQQILDEQLRASAGDAGQLLDAADACLRAGQGAKALDIVLGLDSRGALPAELAARICYHLYRGEETGRARALLKEALRSSPSHPALLREGLRLFAGLDEREERSKMALLLGKRSDAHPNDLRIAADILMDHGSLSDARVFIERLKDLPAGAKDYQLLQAKFDLRQGRPEAAIGQLAEAVRQWPDDAACAMQYAAALWNNGQQIEATGFLLQRRHKFMKSAAYAAILLHYLTQRAEREACAALLAEAQSILTTTAVCIPAIRFWTGSGEVNRAEALFKKWQANTGAPRSRGLAMASEIAEAKDDLPGARLLMEQAYAEGLRDPVMLLALARYCWLALETEKARVYLAERQLLLNRNAVISNQIVNVSQSLIGQLVEEADIDRAARAEVIAVASLDDTQAIEGLSKIVIASPGYTPAAIALIARKLARFEPRNDAPETGIPARIFQFWNDSSPPQDVIRLSETWKAAHPSCSHELFDQRKAEQFLRLKAERSVWQAYRRANSWAQKSDILRLALLFEYGGLYADCDDACFGNVFELYPGCSLMLHVDDKGAIGNNLIGASVRHPFIELCLLDAREAVNRGDHDIVWLSTGPGLLTRTFAAWIARMTPQAEINCGAGVLRAQDLTARVAMHCSLDYKTSKSHWSNAASRGGL